MYRVWLVCCCLGLSGQCVVAQQWQSLFNGRNLDGWQAVGGSIDNWSAEDGVLSCSGEAGSQWLATEDSFQDFELELEFLVHKDGNSGVFVRAPLAGTPYVDGLEVQVLDDHGEKWKSLSPEQMTGSIYAVAGPTEQVTKAAGQWQAMRVRCVGRTITVTINGRQVVNANLDDHLDQAEKVPGIRRTKGYIGLQNHGDPISYRSIRLRKCKQDDES